MKAILTAAGMGSRISRYTNIPKSVMSMNGTPLIKKTVEMLLTYDIKVAVVLGYKSDAIRSALNGLDVKYYYNPFYKVTNSLGSIWFAKDFIDDDIIIANADVFWENDILEKIIGLKHDISIIADRTCAEQGDYLFKLDGDLVTKYGKDLPDEDRDTEYVGIAMIKKSFTDIFKRNLQILIDDGQYNLWWENALYNFCEKYPIHVIDVSEYFWAEIDYIDDYNRIRNYLKTKDINAKYKESIANE